MLFLEILGWFVFSCILMSFIEHQVHAKLMHKKNFLSERTKAFKKTFEMHAIFHHKHYSKIFQDEPVPDGEDQEIRMRVWKGAVKAIPFALPIGVFSWMGAGIFVGVVCMHHWIWNKIHLEMHKPEQRGFSCWPVYKFLARYHFLHHRHPDKNFNVVFPFADYFLGTYVEPTLEDLKMMNELGYCNPEQIIFLKQQEQSAPKKELAGVK